MRTQSDVTSGAGQQWHTQEDFTGLNSTEMAFTFFIQISHYSRDEIKHMEQTFSKELTADQDMQGLKECAVRG